MKAERALPRTFYDRDTARVARDLIGKWILHKEDDFDLQGRIVETEAYLGMIDPASHLFNGFTERTRGTWGRPGIAYVFTLRGHCCLNAITLSDWPYGCVLIRALDSVKGPGRLTKFLKVGLDHNGNNLTRGCLRIAHLPTEENVRVSHSTRVNISKAVDLPLRFYDADSTHRFTGVSYETNR